MEVRWIESSEGLLLEWVCVGASKRELELQRMVLEGFWRKEKN